MRILPRARLAAGYACVCAEPVCALNEYASFHIHSRRTQVLHKRMRILPRARLAAARQIAAVLAERNGTAVLAARQRAQVHRSSGQGPLERMARAIAHLAAADRKSTRLNSSHLVIS